MGTSQEKGKAYEDFSKEILLLKKIKWSYNFFIKNIEFDIDSNEHDIVGISGESHQIDIHLQSSKNPRVHLLCECKAHDPGVEKTHATSFVTVINDIKKKHKKWKIIPVFTADDGFQSGAWKILTYYKIIAIEMKDYRNASAKLTLSESTRTPIYKYLDFKLEDGNIVSGKCLYFSEHVQDYLPLTGSMYNFEILNRKNKIIEPIKFLDYKGKFHSGKQKENANDIIEKSSGKKVIGFRGEIVGNESNYCGSSSYIINSDIITSIKFADGTIYKFYKDGSVKKIQEKKE